MCGIVGSVAKQAVNQDIYDALTLIQHRGQDAAGIMTSEDQHINLRKSNGLVRDAIRQQHMERLRGNMGIGHVRYPTAGSESAAESQPFYVNSPYGLSLVHNGNLTNADSLRRDLIKNDLRHLNTGSDTEVLLNVLAHELQKVGGISLRTKDLFTAISHVYSRVEGAFSAIVMINGYGIVGFRDTCGIRPLIFGQRQKPNGTDYMMASESIALDVLGYQIISDIQPGEAVFIDLSGKVHRQFCTNSTRHHPCIFEYIYLARPDSILDHIPVHKARYNMGVELSKKIKHSYSDLNIDVVIPIPDSSRCCALSLADQLKLPYKEGFIKNRYIGRTFIMPEQSKRRSSVRLKLNPIYGEFEGKNVLLVDDSIVRGTTSKEIIQMARDAGAKKVYFASAAPEVRYPNVYGIDMAIADELVAHGRTVEEVATLIQADCLIYLDLSSVCSAINSAASQEKHKIERFEDSIFTGEYIAGNITPNYLQALANLRSDAAKKKKRSILNEQHIDITEE